MSERSGDNEAEFNVKKEREDVNGAIQRRNPNTSLQSDIKITDLVVDCLEKIFKHLELIDLLNFAESNKRLNRAASVIFNRKYSRHFIILNCHQNSEIMRLEKNSIVINDVYTSLRFMRCFGNSISKLWIRFSYCIKKCCTGLFQYVNEYSAKSLIEFGVRGHGYRQEMFREIQKPFEKVEDLNFSLVALKADQNMFNKYFPQMQNLKIFDCDIDSRCIAAHFPILENVDFSRYMMSQIERQHFDIFILLNTHLKSLILNDYWDGEILQHISQNMHQLEALNIVIPKTASNLPINKNLFHFKSVKRFQISFDICAPSTNIEFLFDQLEEFTVYAMPFNKLQNFVKRNPTINKLGIKNFYQGFFLNDEDVLEVVKLLPALRDLDISEANKSGFSNIFIKRLMTELKQLKILKFSLTKNVLKMTKDWELGDFIHVNFAKKHVFNLVKK